jgi:hypothetical protein
MRITDREHRQIIREVLVTVTPDEAHGATTGRHIKGSAVSSTAEKRFDANPALKTAFKNIKTSTDLEASLQPVLDIVTNNGIDQSELEVALQKLLRTARVAKT